MQDHNIGDANIERLLETAYSPEPVDPAFATKLEADLCEAAKSAWPGSRYSETPAGQATATGVSEYLNPGHPLRRLRKRLGWAMALAASVALAFLVYYASTHQGEPLASQRTPESSADARPMSMGLTARPRIEAPAAQPIAVGSTVATKAGQRRRVALTDGSVLYLNQNTTVKIEAARQIDLRQGEIYLEVAPRDSAARGLATFLIKTPGRDISALGTRFGVQADPQGPGVIVTQGKVKVSGVNEEIHAGQQLAVRQKVVTDAPRATYLLDWTRELMEAAQSPLVPASNYAGGALLAIDPNGQEVKLTLRKFHIDVYIEDGFARTTIDQTYFNNESGRLEGTFYFPLPPDASLSRLAMYVEDGADSKLMEGGMAERDHARNVFETILHQRRDPALLEWVDGSTFKMRVFPLEGRKEKRILLSYTQSMSSLYGTMQYRFPAGHNMDIVRDWTFQARIRDRSQEAGDRLSSPSHPEMKFTRQGSDIVATATAQNVKPNRDVILTLRETDAPQKIEFTGFDHENQHYLMLKWRPDLSFVPNAPLAPVLRGEGSGVRGESGGGSAPSPQPLSPWVQGERGLKNPNEKKSAVKDRERRDWVILFETSANRDPLLARAQIDIVKTLLENVEHDDTFAIITANTRTDVFDTNLRPARADYVKDALAYLEQSHLIGALDLSKALAAAKPFLAKATNPYLVHVGAGIAALGPTKDDVNAKQIPEGVRYVGIGVGKRWNRAFMKMAAERSGGLFTQINPDEPIAWRTFEMLATLNTPRLMDLRVVDAAEKTSFLTETTAIAQGEEIRAFTRTADNLPEKIIVTGKLNGKPFSQTLVVKDVASGAGYLPRTWAKLEIDRLLADGADKNKKAIIDLSMAMYVMTPFTSLLVLEKDEDYATYKVDRGRKDHWAMYDSPPRIPTVYEGLWGQQVKAETKDDGKGEVLPRPKNAPKTADEVLETILVHESGSLFVSPVHPLNRRPRVMTARQSFESRNYTALKQAIGFALDASPAVVTGGFLNDQSETIRVHALFPAISGANIEATVSRWEYLTDNAFKWKEVGSNTRVMILQNGGAAVLAEALQKTITDIRPNAVNVITPAGSKSRGVGENGSKPINITAVGGKLMVTCEDPAALALATELTRSFAANSTGEVDIVRLHFADARETAILLDEAFNGPPVMGFEGRGDRRLGGGGVANPGALLQGLLPAALRVKERGTQRVDRIRVLADPATNALLLEASPLDVLLIRKLLDTQLDASITDANPIVKVKSIGQTGNPLTGAQRFPNSNGATGFWGVANRPMTTVTGSPALQIEFLTEPAINFHTAPRLPVTAEPLETLGVVITRANNPADLELTRQIIGGNGTAPIAIGGYVGAGIGRGFIDVDGSITAIAGGLAPSSNGNNMSLRTNNLFYRTPQLSINNILFTDLTACAPWLHTTMSDVKAVVEAEATADKPTSMGVIPDAARKLIDKSRSVGWQKLTFPGSGRMPAFSLAFNGSGEFTYQRVLESELTETVICDGSTLWSLYPEIGLAGQRPFSRFHQMDYARMVPYFVPNADDLARGADLTVIDAATVAVIPHQAATDENGENPSWALHLVFAGDGRLAERRIVAMPSGTVLIRQTYSIEGSVKTIDGKDNRVLSESKLSVAKADAPNLRPDTMGLLVMEFPLRTAESRLGNLSKAVGPLSKEDRRWMEQYFISTCFVQPSSPLNIFVEHFYGQGDRRLGFYTLLTLSGTAMSPDNYFILNGEKHHFNIEKEHPYDALAAYLARDHQSQNQINFPSFPKNNFIERLAQLKRAWDVWLTDQSSEDDKAKRKAELPRTLKFIEETKSPLAAWAILDAVMPSVPLGQDGNRLIDKVFKDLIDYSGDSYTTRYEFARALWFADRNDEALQKFKDLYLDTFKEGALPPIDSRFINAWDKSKKDWRDDPLGAFMHNRLGELLKQERYYTATLLVWQLWQLDKRSLANDLFQRVLASAPAKYKTPIHLLGLEYFLRTSQEERAAQLLQEVLTDEFVAQNSALWRLSATLAQKRGNLARSATALGKALDLEFKDLPDVINLAPLRDDYRQLLNHYQQVATAVTVLETGASAAGGSEYLNPGHALRLKELLARVVKAADRWRSLDPDNVEVCQLTGRILRTMGAKDLAWDYLTTPIGMKPNESAPWLGLADALHQEGDYELADRAYAAAFEAEPTNPEILRKRAINFESMNRFDQSEQLNMQIRTGNWQPRFQGAGGGFGGGAGALGGGGFGGGAGFGGGGFGGGGKGGGGGGKGGAAKGGGGGGKGGAAKGG